MAKQGLVKVLGRGELTKALTVQAHAFSAGAGARSRRAGGPSSCSRCPGATVRPAARGNALTNR